MNPYTLITDLYRAPNLHGKSSRYVSSLLPKDVRQNDDLAEFAEHTLRLAACGLTAVEMQFGPDAAHAKFISGKLDHNIIATYHNGTHTRLMMLRDALAYARMRRIYDGVDFFPDRDLILLVFAAS